MLDVFKSDGGNGSRCTASAHRSPTGAIDATSYSADLADMCIAHLTREKVRAAYQRSPQLENRR
ncbi:hypothetical protein ABIB80_000259 [Bradyrhizobium sp. i1.15.2]